ncbi:MAG: hypothetical protein FWG21_03930, partial [Oscillospiraceae bacterium]|nr:hypothetical protein [Oscillospiraceae bacterium]
MLCEHCNRLIGITDSVCPYCNNPVTENKSDTETVEADTVVVVDEPTTDTSLSDSFESTQIPLDQQEVIDATDENETDTATQEQRVDELKPRRNALEISPQPEPINKNSYKASRLLIAVAILSVLALFSSIVLFIILPMQQQSKLDNEIVDYLEGSWISDYFAFYDSTSKNYVEVLSIDANGNFTMLYTVPDEKYPDGWANGKWKIEEQIEGQIKYMPDEQRLLLLYELDGVKGCFERFFISQEPDTVCLREFYDETGESY